MTEINEGKGKIYQIKGSLLKYCMCPGYLRESFYPEDKLGKYYIKAFMYAAGHGQV